MMSSAPEASLQAIGRIGVLENLRRVIGRRETIRFLVVGNLESGSRRKVLGHLWSLLDPLFSMGVYFLVFGIGFRQAGTDPLGFVLFLSVGVICWQFMNVIPASVNSVASYRSLLHEVPFPKAILPVTVCLTRLYDFVWSLIVLLVVLLVLRADLSLHLAWLPVLVALQTAFLLGLALVAAYLGSFFADMTNIVSIGMRLWFYASPIFYFARSEGSGVGMIPEAYLPYYMLNPMARFLNAYRDCLLWARAPDAETLGYLIGVSLFSVTLGFTIFSRQEGNFAKYA